MADNDIICKGLKGSWLGPFGQLIQWQMDSDFIGYATLKALKQQVGQFGNPPIRYLFNNADRFDSLSVSIWEQTVQWNLEFEKLSLPFEGNKRALGLARNVSRRRLNDIKQHIARGKHRREMTKDYLEDVYVSMYEAPIEREKYENGVRFIDVQSRLKVIRPYVMDGIGYFTSQLIQHGDVRRLTLMPQRKSSPDREYLDEVISFK